MSSRSSRHQLLAMSGIDRGGFDAVMLERGQQDLGRTNASEHRVEAAARTAGPSFGQHATTTADDGSSSIRIRAWIAAS